MTEPRHSPLSQMLHRTIIACISGLPVHAKYSGGSGTAQDPYQIAAVGDLIALGETPEECDKHFILTADVDPNPKLPGRKVFNGAVIAPNVDRMESGFHGTAFTGVFDGNGHTISHPTISGNAFLGLFGRLVSSAEVRNLGPLSAQIDGSGCLDGLVEWNNGGTVTQSYSAGVVNGS